MVRVFLQDEAPREVGEAIAHFVAKALGWILGRSTAKPNPHEIVRLACPSEV
jgi:hypothetical protein